VCVCVGALTSKTMPSHLIALHYINFHCRSCIVYAVGVHRRRPWTGSLTNKIQNLPACSAAGSGLFAADSGFSLMV
jgi:hypothetical protein